MPKRCSWGLCNSDDRYPDWDINVRFVPFVTPVKVWNREKCLRWIKACGRPHDQLNIDNVGRWRFICSKHFVDGWPSIEHPDPVDVTPSTNVKKRRLPVRRADPTHAKKRRRTVANVQEREPAGKTSEIEADTQVAVKTELHWPGEGDSNSTMTGKEDSGEGLVVNFETDFTGLATGCRPIKKEGEPTVKMEPETIADGFCSDTGEPAASETEVKIEIDVAEDPTLHWGVTAEPHIQETSVTGDSTTAAIAVNTTSSTSVSSDNMSDIREDFANPGHQRMKNDVNGDEIVVKLECNIAEDPSLHWDTTAKLYAQEKWKIEKASEARELLPSQQRRLHHCAVAGCDSKAEMVGEDVIMHPFPESMQTRRKWVNFVRACRDDFGPKFGTPNVNSRICSLHFSPHDLYFTSTMQEATCVIRVILRKGAVPTVQKVTKAVHRLTVQKSDSCQPLSAVTTPTAVTAMTAATTPTAVTTAPLKDSGTVTSVSRTTCDRSDIGQALTIRQRHRVLADILARVQPRDDSTGVPTPTVQKKTGALLKVQELDSCQTPTAVTTAVTRTITTPTAVATPTAVTTKQQRQKVVKIIIKRQTDRFCPGGDFCSCMFCFNCRNKESCIGISFHSFPKDAERCAQWMHFSRRDWGQMGPATVFQRRYLLCSDHFEDCQYNAADRKSLRWTAVPTLFPLTNPPPKALADMVASVKSRNDSTALKWDHKYTTI